MSDRPEWVETILTAVGQTRADVTRLGSDVTQLGSDVTQLGSGVTRLGSEVTQLVAQLGSEVAQLRSEVAQVRADVMERIDRLQDTVTAMHDEDVVNFGATERAERIAYNSREEVRGQGDTLNALVRAQGEQINALVRQVRRPHSDVRGIRGES